MHVKETLLSLVKVMLRDKHPHKSESDMTRTLDAIQKGKIDDWMWTKIIEKMYEERDSQALHEKIRDVIESRRSEHGDQANIQRKPTREELNSQAIAGTKESSKLMYRDFLKVILDFQLTEHERFLQKFTSQFKVSDRDTNGVLNEDEFKELIQSMNIVSSEEEIEYLLQAVDPNNNQKMTYSEVVHLLSSHMVPRDESNP